MSENVRESPKESEMSEDPGTKNDIITLLSWDDFGMIWDRVGRYKYFVNPVPEYKKSLYFFRVAFRVA